MVFRFFPRSQSTRADLGTPGETFAAVGGVVHGGSDFRDFDGSASRISISEILDISRIKQIPQRKMFVRFWLVHSYALTDFEVDRRSHSTKTWSGSTYFRQVNVGEKDSSLVLLYPKNQSKKTSLFQIDNFKLQVYG